MWKVHKPMQNADFGLNIVPTCEYKTSRDLANDGPMVIVNLVSKDAQDLIEIKS